MNFLKSLSDKTKSDLDIWFFYGFLMTFTLSIRKVLFYFPLDGIFNEYSGIYIYISDVFLFFALISWQIHILCNKSISLSSIKLWISKFFHNLYLFLPFLLVLWSFSSIFWSQNQAIALFRSIKLLELYLLYLFIIFRIVPRGTIPMTKKGTIINCSTPAPLVSNVPRGTFDTFAGWNNLFLIIIGLGFIQSFLGIIQFIKQKSVGLYFLKESLIGPDVPGVAKIILNGHKYIRSYGLFPHPNMLGGFLIVSIIFTLLYLKLFHVEQVRIAKNKRIFLKAVILVQILCLILTFSKSAILGLIIGLGYIYWERIVPRGTITSSQNNSLMIKMGSTAKKLFHVEQFRIIFLGLAVFLILLVTIIKPDINSIFIQSLNERYLYLNISRGTILENPILGVGVGQFVVTMQKFSPIIFQPWQYQPVHNVFLLIWAELGLAGLVLFSWLLKIMFHVEQNNNKIVPRGTIYLKATLLGLIFISFFDHYLWSIQQGGILLWIILGLIVGITKVEVQREEKIVS